MSRWFRYYDEALDDPKVQKLPGELFKAWVNLLCVASKNKGMIPPADAAFALRMADKELARTMQSLVSAGLIDDVGGAIRPHKWTERQYESDGSASRMRRHRQRHSDADVTSHVTGPETEADNRTEIPPTPLSGGLVSFEGRKKKRRGQSGESPMTPEQQEETRLETLAWAVERGMINIAGNGRPQDFRKLIDAGRLTQEQVEKLGLRAA